MRILVKFPSRGRREQFIKVVKFYKEYCELPDTQIMVTLDYADREMCTSDMFRMFEREKINWVVGISKNKIDACNRDLKFCHGWEIVMLASDDMIPQVRGYDKIISDAMQKHFPDTDGCLHFNDGYTEDRLQTMVIFGKKYFDRFGYLYHPDYISLWSDNEQMEVAKMLGKYKYFDTVLFKHEHYANNKNVKYDIRYKQTEQWYAVDKKTYERRKSINFGL